MEWQNREESQNVEDRRRISPQAGMALGGGGILIVIIALIFGLDPRQVQQVVGNLGGGGGAQQGKEDPNIKFTAAQEEQAKFSKVIFGDTERIWTEIFAKSGKKYKEPKLVLFTGRVQSACGSASAAVGPFYCPGDHKVYIDCSFYEEMDKKLKAGGDFARAYVIAHEVGHHVQNLLGYSAKVDSARGTALENQMSVRLELQADYLAGVWAHYAQKKYNFLQDGDVEEAMNAAKQIGDDTLQKNATGTVRPEAFTHGTSKQRVKWFYEGLKSGNLGRLSELFDLPYERL